MSIKISKKFKKIKKNSGFTLLEMLIVLVTISIILGMTIYFGSENIFKLKYKTTKEEFLSTLTSFYTNSLGSNYINQHRFNRLNLELFSGNNGIFYSYVGDSYNQTGEKKTNLIEISDIRLDNGIIQNKSSINITPYQLGCEITDNNNNTGSRIDFKLIVNKTKIYCLYLLSQNCKIKEQICL
ncbi:MAG: type II secretion system protein [Candidatus Absconditicoccaceae bacterium]